MSSCAADSTCQHPREKVVRHFAVIIWISYAFCTKDQSKFTLDGILVIRFASNLCSIAVNVLLSELKIKICDFCFDTKLQKQIYRINTCHYVCYGIFSREKSYLAYSPTQNHVSRASSKLIMFPFAWVDYQARYFSFTWLSKALPSNIHIFVSMSSRNNVYVGKAHLGTTLSWINPT